MEWVDSTLHTTSEHGVSSITAADEHTSAVSSRLNRRSPADLNGLVRFAEKRNMVFCAFAITFQTRSTSVCIVNLLVLMTDREGVYCAVRAECLNIIQVNSRP
jgi:hypothetical protein